MIYPRNYHEECVLIVAAFICAHTVDSPDHPTVVIGWVILGMAVLYWLVRTVWRIVKRRREGT